MKLSREEYIMAVMRFLKEKNLLAKLGHYLKKEHFRMTQRKYYDEYIDECLVLKYSNIYKYISMHYYNGAYKYNFFPYPFFKDGVEREAMRIELLRYLNKLEEAKGYFKVELSFDGQWRYVN